MNDNDKKNATANPNSLAPLPAELRLAILGFSSFHDVIRFSATNKDYHNLIETNIDAISREIIRKIDVTKIDDLRTFVQSRAVPKTYLDSIIKELVVKNTTDEATFLQLFLMLKNAPATTDEQIKNLIQHINPQDIPDTSFRIKMVDRLLNSEDFLFYESDIAALLQQITTNNFSGVHFATALAISAKSPYINTTHATQIIELITAENIPDPMDRATVIAALTSNGELRLTDDQSDQIFTKISVENMADPPARATALRGVVSNRKPRQRDLTKVRQLISENTLTDPMLLATVLGDMGRNPKASSFLTWIFEQADPLHLTAPEAYATVLAGIAENASNFDLDLVLQRNVPTRLSLSAHRAKVFIKAVGNRNIVGDPLIQVFDEITRVNQLNPHDLATVFAAMANDIELPPDALTRILAETTVANIPNEADRAKVYAAVASNRKATRAHFNTIFELNTPANITTPAHCAAICTAAALNPSIPIDHMRRILHLLDEARQQGENWNDALNAILPDPKNRTFFLFSLAGHSDVIADDITIALELITEAIIPDPADRSDALLRFCLCTAATNDHFSAIYARLTPEAMSDGFHRFLVLDAMISNVANSNARILDVLDHVTNETVQNATDQLEIFVAAALHPQATADVIHRAQLQLPTEHWHEFINSVVQKTAEANSAIRAELIQLATPERMPDAEMRLSLYISALGYTTAENITVLLDRLDREDSAVLSPEKFTGIIKNTANNSLVTTEQLDRLLGYVNNDNYPVAREFGDRSRHEPLLAIANSPNTTRQHFRPDKLTPFADFPTFVESFVKNGSDAESCIDTVIQYVKEINWSNLNHNRPQEFVERLKNPIHALTAIFKSESANVNQFGLDALPDSTARMLFLTYLTGIRLPLPESLKLGDFSIPLSKIIESEPNRDTSGQKLHSVLNKLRDNPALLDEAHKATVFVATTLAPNCRELHLRAVFKDSASFRNPANQMRVVTAILSNPQAPRKLIADALQRITPANVPDAMERANLFTIAARHSAIQSDEIDYILAQSTRRQMQDPAARESVFAAATEARIRILHEQIYPGAPYEIKDVLTGGDVPTHAVGFCRGAGESLDSGRRTVLRHQSLDDDRVTYTIATRRQLQASSELNYGQIDADISRFSKGRIPERSTRPPPANTQNVALPADGKNLENFSRRRPPLASSRSSRK